MPDKTEFKVEPSAQQEVEGVEKRPCLVMIKGDFIGQVYDLNDDVTVIGRDDDAELVLSDTLVSRKHAKITINNDGFHLTDLGSTNGCQVNKEKVTNPVSLHEGDKITLGGVIFKFSFQDKDDAQYHEMMRNMAVKDGLTRIYNKRYFSELLEKEFDFSRRNEVALALVLFDIDHFKQINDSWGHPAGDYILKYLARLIENEARGYDVFARYGGEEFVFMLRGESLEAAIALAERVRVDVERHVFHYDEMELKITISFGVAWWKGDESISNAEELVEVADKYLYKAKNDGRNCVRYN